MEAARHSPEFSLRADWRAHARAHPYTAWGLRIAIGVLLLLLLTSSWRLLGGEINDALPWGFLGGTAGFAATALGALPALFLRDLSTRIEDTFLGLAAGMMLAASSFSLLLPGLEAGADVTGSRVLGGLAVVAGLGLGVLLMIGLDQFTPHEHEQTGSFGPGRDRLSRVWLFVAAIALHNLPERLAVAVSLRSAGLTSGLAVSYPVGLGIAAGSMNFVVSHEVIPETHRNGHQTPATLGLMAGFAIMMLLDTTLG